MIVVRWVLPDGARIVHATTSGPDSIGDDRVVEALCGESVTVPVGPRRVTCRHVFCDGCVFRHAAMAGPVVLRWPRDGFDAFAPSGPAVLPVRVPCRPVAPAAVPELDLWRLAVEALLGVVEASGVPSLVDLCRVQDGLRRL